MRREPRCRSAVKMQAVRSKPLCFAALGLRTLSMRPASVGPVKHLLRRVDLNEVRAVMDTAIANGDQSVRRAVSDWLVYQV